MGISSGAYEFYPTRTAFQCFNFQLLPKAQPAMLSCQLKLSASRITILPKFAYAVEQTTYSTSCAPLLKNVSPCFGRGFFSSCKVPYSCRATHKDINASQTSHVVESCEGIKSDLLEELTFTANVRIDSLQHNSEDDKEIQRTKKIGHGNKGRVPWNKGRKHSEETRERIRHRTKEAMKDPKVRKKMSEAPRALSNQTKTKIRTSLRKLWGERLKWKRSRERFLQSWAESIAKAAKVGGRDQDELEWDSYDKLKQELALLQIHEDAKRAKARELARIRAQRAAQVKTEKMARLAQKRREQEERAKSGGEITRKKNKKSKEEKEKLAEFHEEKLKERLMKIHKKKPKVSLVSSQHRRPWEEFDLDFARAEQLQKDISLADQIRFAKNRRAEQLLDSL